MYISSWQALSPFFIFWKNRHVLREIYPFNQPGASYYYYARSGIYYLGQNLRKKGFTHVLFPAYHHGNEVKALLAAGLNLIYYNVLESGEIDFDDLESRIDGNTHILYIIHYNGFPQKMDRIAEICKQSNLLLIEDAALSLFSKWGNRYLGEFGDVSIFCLYKTLQIPNGGMILVNNPEFSVQESSVPPAFLSTFSRYSSLHMYWLDNHFDGIGYALRKLKSGSRVFFSAIAKEPVAVMDSRFDLDIVTWGISRLSEFIINRSNIEEIISIRRRNYAYILSHLDTLPENFRPMFSELGAGVVPLFFLARVENREYLLRKLREDGIDCSRFWRQRHPDVPHEQFPGIANMRDTVLELPIHQTISIKQLNYILDRLKFHLKHKS